MRALFVQHHHLSLPGEVGLRFTELGYDVVEHLVVTPDRRNTPDVESRFPDAADYDVIVPMGAPWSVYDHEAVGIWVQPELDMLRSAHRKGVPVLGICFGGQLLALAHGGCVAASPDPEIGWHAVESDDETLVPSGEWFQWHDDRWQLPEGAREIARNSSASQAFVLGRNLAVQFHPELDAPTLAGWLGNGGAAKLAEQGIDPVAVVARTQERGAESRERAGRLVDAFLDQVATR